MQMKKYFVKILSQLLLLAFLFSTTGFILSYSFCGCKDSLSVNLFETDDHNCTDCHVPVDLSKSEEACCAQHYIKETECCNTEFYYIKYNPETTASSSSKILVNNIYILPIQFKLIENEINQVYLLYPERYISPPPLGGVQLLIFTHQLKSDPCTIS